LPVASAQDATPRRLLRNNLFHGVKWAYGIRGQQPNFEHGADILMGMLELQPP